MQFRPNDAPVMELGEVRTALFSLTGVAGVNSIDNVTVTCPTLSIGTASPAGLTVSAPITADRVGQHMVKVAALLSSQEQTIGYVRVTVVDSSQLIAGATRYE
jgi:hypothetical protein